MRLLIRTSNKKFVESYVQDCKEAHTPITTNQIFLEGGGSLLYVDNICIFLGEGDTINNLQLKKADS